MKRGSGFAVRLLPLTMLLLNITKVMWPGTWPPWLLSETNVVLTIVSSQFATLYFRINLFFSQHPERNAFCPINVLYNFAGVKLLTTICLFKLYWKLAVCLLGRVQLTNSSRIISGTFVSKIGKTCWCHGLKQSVIIFVLWNKNKTDKWRFSSSCNS